MSNIPVELKYAKTHEWARQNDDGSVTVGITDNAQDQLGDMVYIEVPEKGQTVLAQEACAVVESVKAASDVYSPVTGAVVEVNESLAESPETVNQDAYGAGWLFRVQPSDAGELDGLMDGDTYAGFLEDEAH
ncbi:MAG TPA: glycine cleavage system protein GcvH [Gammaproteobacteria bacterium]|nr:glycine cleavage system protein GcvH [Gammaproteobacteria bacterium]